MKYFLYSEEDGKVHSYGESPDTLTESYIPGLLLIEAGQYTRKDLPLLNVINGVLVTSSPTVRMASPYEIKQTWQHMEQSPIEVFGMLVDCDSLSELRMKNAIDNWDELPDILGQMETDVAGVRKIYWSMSSGKVGLSFSQLTDIFVEMLRMRAIRAAVLFSNYQRIKSLPSVALSYIQDETNWFM